ncbi:transmembrane protease serine 11G-like [Dasypus novemcinctus]|uniref:transmembrane protease serine 11G-like n=1 Tax=Dasypus novemcinctus TaxID=9361 RepID=UPI0039C91AEE
MKFIHGICSCALDQCLCWMSRNSSISDQPNFTTWHKHLEIHEELQMEVDFIAIGHKVGALEKRIKDIKIGFGHATYARGSCGINDQMPGLGVEPGTSYVGNQKIHYYQASFQIPSIEYNPDFSVEHSKNGSDLKKKINNEIDNIFRRSSLNHPYLKSHVVNLRPNNDGLQINVLLQFQFASSNADAIKRQADNILHQKLESDESFLKIDTSLPYLRGVNKAQAEHILNSCCGIGKESPLSSMDRIADGDVARKAAWPWQASLQIDGIHFCGASLISDEWLLTAAHCFDTYKNPRLWTASFGTTLNPPLMRTQVQSIIVHENYAAHKHDDDIAVLKLATPVRFSDDVHRVCLPDVTFEVLPKSKVFVTGWGALKANVVFESFLVSLGAQTNTMQWVGLNNENLMVHSFEAKKHANEGIIR